MTGSTITERRDQCVCTEVVMCLFHYDAEQRRTARTVWSRPRPSSTYKETVRAIRRQARRGDDDG
jgi:hypothetical protein